MGVERRIRDTSVIKLDSSRSPRGPGGEKYLASGVRVSMRLWESEPPTDGDPRALGESERDYEVVGYVVSGRAELHVEEQTVLLEPGSSYVVPRGARHFYRVLEPLTAVEATSPPAHVHGRDEPTFGPSDDRAKGVTRNGDVDSDWRPSDAPAARAHRR